MDVSSCRGYAQAAFMEASEALAAARSLDEVVQALRATARSVIGAEGIAVIVREDGRCFYAAEDAIGPLWAGSRFNEEVCVSGWAMANLETVAIPDIRLDERVPQDAYAPTFVRSLILAPIGRPKAIAALGAYWSDAREHDPETVRMLEGLARMAAIALENARLLRQADESARQRSLMLAAGRMGTWSYDLVTGELVTSETCRIVFGRDPEEPFHYADVRAATHPEDAERVVAAIAASFETGEDYQAEYRIVTPAGEVRWISVRGQPSYAPDGSAATMEGLLVDVTDRRRMEEALRSSADTLEHLVEERTRELVAAQDALRQAQKLDAMGQLTGGVAHDFNNLLSPILGSLDLLQRKGVGGEREQRLIGAALQSAERAKTLVQRLLAFARRQPLKPEPVDLSALLEGMRDLLSSTLGPLVEVAMVLPGDLPLAVADPHQVEMAVLNLAVNARDAMPDGGRIEFSVESCGTRSESGDACLALVVRDTGCGMDGPTLERAIEPFFSTKGVGKGTGLGLSMVHGLASQLGGSLAIDSRPGEGTAVTLLLPASGERQVREVQPTALPTTMAGRALLVDDEELVRAATSDMLVEMGFEVVEARSGADALEIFRRTPGIDILVTDHLMPGMTGIDLAHSILAERAGLPVLLVSGYSDAKGVDLGLPFLEKPFRQGDLARRISSLMAAH